MILTRLTHGFWNSVSALLFLACAGTASADTVLGPLLEFPQSYDLLVSHAPGNFLDYVYFEVGPLQRVTNTAVSLNLRYNAGLNFNINGLNIGFYDLADTFYGIANGIGDPQEAVLEQTLLPGSYYAAISGFANGSAGGKYAYSISAVPEADKWLLMLLGFAAVSFKVFRRKR